MILGVLLAGLVGGLLGLLGGGGSILTVPIFVYVLGFGAKQAIAMSLGVVGVVSLVGAISYWRAGQVNVRLGLSFGAVAMVATYVGARLSAFIGGGVQLTLFAVVMLGSAVFMLRGRSALDGAVPRPAPIPFHLIALKGIAVGLLAGVVGVGGGFLIVPALVLLGRVPVKQAIGTSLMVIAMNSAAGFTGYLGQVELPLAFLGMFTAVAVAGILTGSFAARRVRPAQLQRAFAVLLIFMGTFILYQNRAVVMTMLPGHAHAEVRSNH